jgi:LAO/AO transport system kinase
MNPNGGLYQMSANKKGRMAPEAYLKGILSGDRVILSKAITLVESKLEADNLLATALLQLVMSHTGRSLRIGITGVPGVGKSTFIEAFGTLLTSLGKKVAVLAIDPSSQRTGGSILGDKTRMEHLANHPAAYIRPSATGSSLGGVARKTREAMLLCEAAGFDIILIETVGVGQSEVAVKNMVDFFLLLMLSGAGDELQGIKKGIMEMADAIAITKADGDNQNASKRAQAEYKNALHLFPPAESGWLPPVTTCSAVTSDGMETIWKTIQQYQAHTTENGYFDANRQQQQLLWMHEIIEESLRNQFQKNIQVQKILPEIEKKVAAGEMSSGAAAAHLLQLYFEEKREC